MIYYKFVLIFKIINQILIYSLFLSRYKYIFEVNLYMITSADLNTPRSKSKQNSKIYVNDKQIKDVKIKTFYTFAFIFHFLYLCLFSLIHQKLDNK